MSRYTSGRFGVLSALALPVLLLNLVAWLILLAGLSALQYQCKKQGEVINGDVPVGQIFPATVCRNVYRFQWWTVWLQFIVLVGALVSVAFSLINHHRGAIIGFLAIVTVLLINDVNTFLYVHDAINRGSLWRRSNVYFAGALISSFLNFLLILTLGHSGDTYGTGRGAAPTGTHTHAPAGTAGTAPGQDRTWINNGTASPLPASGTSAAPATGGIGSKGTAANPAADTGSVV